MNLRTLNKPAPIRASTLLALAAAMWAGNSGAVTIYRCGVTGNSFSDRPCADGQAFDADDARSDAQRAEAVRIAAIERQLAAEMQRERIRLGAVAPRAAAGFHASSPPPAMPIPTTDAGHRDTRRTTTQRLPFTTAAARAEFVAFAPPIKVNRR